MLIDDVDEHDDEVDADEIELIDVDDVFYHV